MSIRATNEEIVQAYMSTGSVWKAAKSLGICGQSVWERLRRLNIQLSASTWTEEEKKQAYSLAEQGIPISRIAENLGRTYAGVACMLSRGEIKHPYRPPRKPKRGKGLTKKRMLEVWKHVDKSGHSLAKTARWLGLSTTGLTAALQLLTPEKWKSYVNSHSELVPSTCPGCKQQFIKLTKKQLYCTNRCGAHARIDKSYFGGNRLKTIGLADGICQLCLKKKDVLSSHHVFGKENDAENDYLIALCPGCHKLVTLLGRYGSRESSEFWENLIVLACLRGQGNLVPRPVGFHVLVDIDRLADDDVEIEEAV